MLQKNMTINFRNDEERNAFCIIGEKEGVKWQLHRGTLSSRHEKYDAVHINKDKKALTAPYNYKENDKTKVVEAANLFGNHIISMKLKGG